MKKMGGRGARRVSSALASLGTSGRVVLAAVVAGALLLSPVGCDWIWGRGKGASASRQEVTGYHCPMHPEFHSDKPGKCEICGMNLVPNEKPAATPAAQKGHDHAGMEEMTGMPGTGAPAEAPGTVVVSAEKRQLIGVKLAPVERRALTKAIRTVGRVEYDERRIVHVHTKIDGWIHELYVNATGQPVRKGELLFSIYSPQLVSTQEEYLIALRGREALRKATTPEGREGGEALVRAARRRFRLWDVPESEIRRLEREGKARTYLTFTSPIEGIVIEKQAFEGLHVTPGTDLMTVADLSMVWVNADVYEYELAFLREGQPVTLTLSYLPGRTFTGKIAYIYPYLKEKTRTATVRIEVPNPDGILKPMMYADVRLESPMGETLTVPDTAVMDTGERRVVFVDRGEGRFETRDVEVGRRAQGYVEVLSGLAEGERVSVAANFMIDAETRLREAVGGGAHAGHGAPGGGEKPAGPSAEPPAPPGEHAGHGKDGRR